MGNYHNPYYESLRGDENETEFKPSQEPTRMVSDTDAAEVSRTTSSRKVIPESLFRKILEKCGLPSPNDPLAEKRVLRDAIFPAISQALNDRGQEKWSLSPRTFSILWILNIPNVMDSFVAEGRTDRYLPYHEANLPNCIPGGLRSRFMKLQSLVRYHLADVRELEESGKHVHLPRNADAYFFSMEDLGSGRFAKVDKVRSYRTADIYARKQIRRGESVLEDHTQLKAFENELKSLKEVSHRHAVKLVGSYTDPHHLALIMSPIADVDLKRHLQRCEKSLDNRKFILRHFFGCLTTALAYIHSKNIRHKDIKPENILVKGDTVYLADFGTSKVCLDGHLTTNGEPKEGTPRYWAPEAGYHAVSRESQFRYVILTQADKVYRIGTAQVTFGLLAVSFWKWRRHY